MKRGEIYFIKSHNAVGSEYKGACPGIIVSNKVLTETSTVVEVVYLTTKTKKNMPTHTVINATGTPSTALCEQISTVDKSLLGRYAGTCTEEEMQAVEKAMLCSLGIEMEEAPKNEAEQHDDELDAALEVLKMADEIRNRYARIIDYFKEAEE